MKRKIFTFLIVLIAFLTTACQSATTTTLNVSGMSCGRCENSVTVALTEIGVEVVNVSASNNRVVFEFDEDEISLEEIKAVISELGFDVD